MFLNSHKSAEANGNGNGHAEPIGETHEAEFQKIKTGIHRELLVSRDKIFTSMLLISWTKNGSDECFECIDAVRTCW